jgi:hypothetical protein
MEPDERETLLNRTTVFAVLRHVFLGTLFFATTLYVVSWLYSRFIVEGWTYPHQAFFIGLLGPYFFLGVSTSAWLVLPVVVGLEVMRQAHAREVGHIVLRRARIAMITMASVLWLGYLIAQLVSTSSAFENKDFISLRIDIATLIVIVSAVLLDIQTRRNKARNGIN